MKTVKCLICKKEVKRSNFNQKTCLSYPCMKEAAAIKARRNALAAKRLRKLRREQIEKYALSGE